jgi:hypothetical protein
MEIDQEQLALLKEYAGCLMNISDIAVLLGFDEDVLRDEISNKHSPTSKAYRKAKAEVVFELRKQEIEMAKLGSPQAVELTQRYIIDQKIQENG